MLYLLQHSPTILCFAHRDDILLTVFVHNWQLTADYKSERDIAKVCHKLIKNSQIES